MSDADKKSFSERDICTKFITPAIVEAGWDVMTQFREEVSFTKGRILVRGRKSSRGEARPPKPPSPRCARNCARNWRRR